MTPRLEPFIRLSIWTMPATGSPHLSFPASQAGDPASVHV